MEKLTVGPSPHVRDEMTTSQVMTHVLVALLPTLGASAVIFGGRALMLTGFCIITALFWESICNLIMKRPDSTGDLSAAVTGMILAFNLPVTMPYWMAAIGTFVAIVIVKQLFGGLGQNFANPAIVGRIVLMLSFTAEMTTWTAPMTDGNDLLTTPTPLISKVETYFDLFVGRVGGCMGEVCAFALILGGLYLVVMRIITPHCPLAFIGTVLAFSYLVGEDGIYQILSGGVMLGAIFMATDYVTSPITGKGKIIFGIGCGLITCLIRFYGSYAEGVSYAILIMNILTPYINMITESKPVGAVKPKKEKEGSEK